LGPVARTRDVALAIASLLALAVALSACGEGSLGGVPSSSVGPFTAAQVHACEVVTDRFGEWPDISLPHDVAAARASLAVELDKDLGAARLLTRPSAAGAEWDALLARLESVRAALKTKMKASVFKNTYATLQRQRGVLFKACSAVTDWGKANLPQSDDGRAPVRRAG
jgi:hypothetical protein